MAFYFPNVELLVSAVLIDRTCAGGVCDGQYGCRGKCPCSRTAHLPRPVLSIKLAIDNIQHPGMTSSVDGGFAFEPFASNTLTDRLANFNDLQASNIVWCTLLYLENYFSAQIFRFCIIAKVHFNEPTKPSYCMMYF